MAVGIRCADHTTPLYPQKLALTSSTSAVVRSVEFARGLTYGVAVCDHQLILGITQLFRLSGWVAGCDVGDCASVSETELDFTSIYEIDLLHVVNQKLRGILTHLV
jgi:hypothetical protein